jgi:hypothetical protein
MARKFRDGNGEEERRARQAAKTPRQTPRKRKRLNHRDTEITEKNTEGLKDASPSRFVFSVPSVSLWFNLFLAS